MSPTPTQEKRPTSALLATSSQHTFICQIAKGASDSIHSLPDLKGKQTINMRARTVRPPHNNAANMFGVHESFGEELAALLVRDQLQMQHRQNTSIDGTQAQHDRCHGGRDKPDVSQISPRKTPTTWPTRLLRAKPLPPRTPPRAPKAQHDRCWPVGHPTGNAMTTTMRHQTPGVPVGATP